MLHEKTTTVKRADFRVVEIRQWRWVLYPWAVVEDVSQFIRDMQPAPRNVDEIRQRLEDQYGFVPSPYNSIGCCISVARDSIWKAPGEDRNLGQWRAI